MTQPKDDLKSLQKISLILASKYPAIPVDVLTGIGQDYYALRMGGKITLADDSQVSIDETADEG